MAYLTQDELKYAKEFARYYQQLGENMKLADWEKLQKFREPFGIDIRRSNQIVAYVKENWDEFSGNSKNTKEFLTQDELKYAKEFARYYQQLGENIKLADWEKLQKFREPFGLDIRRSNQIVAYVKENWDEFSGNSKNTKEFLTQDELKYAKEFARYYQQLGENMKLADWEKLQKFREPFGIDIRRSNQIVAYVKENWDEFSGNKPIDKGKDITNIIDAQLKASESAVEVETEEEMEEKTETEVISRNMTARSSRRRQAQQDIGIQQIDQQQELAKSLAKEEERKRKKEARKREIEESGSYMMTKGIATVMDKYFLDPIIGLIPGVGDILSSTLMLPSIYVSLFKIKSIPLTLAVVLNILIDSLIGIIPFWIGNIVDIFNRAYLKNMRLIVGYVEDDKQIIEEVNQKATISAVLIALVIGLIWLMVELVAAIAGWIGDLFGGLFG